MTSPSWRPVRSAGPPGSTPRTRTPPSTVSSCCWTTRRGSATVCTETPIRLRRTRPSLISRPATNLAVLIAIAKQIPCAGRIIAVLTPMTSPRELTSGPPELPGFRAASVCKTSSISRPDWARSERPRALMTPAVTVH